MSNYKLLLISIILIVISGLVIFLDHRGLAITGSIDADQSMDRYFRPDEVMEINIQIAEADWQDLLADALSEEYYTASVTVNGDYFPLVQIRAKGNSSLKSVARTASTRYSFKINFDGINNEQTMAGIRQLNLNNNFSDPSSMREYLSYQIFGQMGVAVPLYGYAALYINGQYHGLYLAVESIDEPYLERNFGHFTGDLYKSTGHALTYEGDDPSAYSKLVVESSRKNPDFSSLLALIKALDSGESIERHLNVDAFLRYLAVSTALANFDSYQGRMAHNYYLYEQDGIFTILPWDLNMAFGGFDLGGDPTKIYIDEPTQGALATKPLIAALFSNEQYLSTYHLYLEEVVVNYLDQQYLQAETDRLFNLVKDHVKADPTAFYSYDQFVKNISETVIGAGMGGETETARSISRNVPGILELAAIMSDTITNQLEGKTRSSNNGSGMDGRFNMGGAGLNGLDGQAPAQIRPPREDLEAFMDELRAAGGLNEELRTKAIKMGIPRELLTRFLEQDYRLGPAILPPGEAGWENTQQAEISILPVLLTSAAFMVLALFMLMFFHRRYYSKCQ